MVDRSGLDYTIAVRNQFSAQIARLRRELREARGDFRSLGAASRQAAQSGRAAARQQTSAQREASRATRENARAAKAAQREQNAGLRRLAERQRDRSRREREFTRILKTATRERQAEERRRAAAARRAAAEERRALRALKARRREQRRFVRGLLRTDNAANRVAFTFRRLFGILAAFAVARLVVEAFARGIVGTGIAINRSVEDSQISIASLIAAVGTIRNAQGELVTGQQAFALATLEARRQIQLLRQDAVATTATFAELLFAFQTATGPGLAAGFNLDQIRALALRISQAASALGLAGNQLPEEIRSLFQGTINPRNTRIATALGITNDDIRKARDAGKLFEFLQGELDAFRFAARETQKSFSGLLSNVSDAFSLAAQPAALGVFEGIKDSLSGIIDLFAEIERDDDGEITNVLPRPEAVAILAALFDSLKVALVAVRDAASNIGFEDLLRAASAVGAILIAVGQAIAGFVQGFVEGLSFVTRVVAQLTSAFGGSGLENIREFVREATRIGIVLIAASIAAALIKGALTLLLVPLRIALGLFNTLFTVVGGIARFIKRLPLGITLVVAGAFAALFFFKQWVDEIAGFEVKLSTLGKILSNLFLDTVQIVAQRIRTTFVTVFEGIRSFAINIVQTSRILIARIATGIANFFRTTIAGILNFVSLAINDIADKLPDFLSATRAQLIGLGAALSGSAASLTKGAKDSTEELAATVLDAENKIAGAESRRLNRIAEAIGKLKDLETQLSQNFLDAINEDVDAPTIISKLQEQVLQLKTTLDGLFETFGLDGDDVIDVEDIAAKIREAVEKGFDGITGKGEKSKLELLFDELAANVDGTLNIARASVQGFSRFVASTLVDAFDPTKDVDILERFARFLQEIASLIIQQLTQVAVAKAVLSIASFQGGGQVGLKYGGTVPQSLADGGKVNAASPSPTMAHYGLPGKQPLGIDPRDTQPIWAQPGEFMQPVNAVRRYGLDAMEKIRRGLINPGELRALASGVGNVSSLKRSINRGPGFQEGGLIGDNISAVREELQGVRDAQAQGGTVGGSTPAFIVADERSVDALLNGGRSAVLRFFRENSEEIDGMLRSSRAPGA